MKYSKDGKVYFNELTHIYMLDEKKLKGVTGLISQFKQPFESEKIATAYAFKHGLKKEDVLAEWKLKGDKATNDGSAVHKIIEDYILKGSLSDGMSYPKEETAIQFIKDYFKTGKLIPVEVEMIVYNENLATQIDCIARNSKNEYFILDWKTNSKIEAYSYQGRKMFTPFDEYMDCSLIHYSIQVELCRILCKEYKIKQCFIVHLKDDSYEIIPAQKINIPKSIL